MGVLNFKVLLFGAVLVAGLAFYERPVFPATASNHGLKTFTGLGYKLIQLVSSVGGTLGFSSINITRTLLDAVKLFDNPTDRVETYTTTMDGVEVMVFKPTGKSKGLRPGIIHYHGGGWVLLSPQLYAPFLRDVVEQTQSVLVSVNYRMAPEYLYPIPLEDCLKASRHFIKNARKYGVDENRIGVKGDSAGGNLAMAVALKLSKEEDLPPLKFMSLDYPVLQFFDFSLPSYQKYEHGPGFITKRMIIAHALLYAFGNLEYFDMLYENQHVKQELKESKYPQYVSKDLLPLHIQNDATNITTVKKTEDAKQVKIPAQLTTMITDPYFAPLMASDEDLELLPPTYIFNAEFDVLRDEGFLLAARLRHLGKKVKATHLITEEHGFFNFASLDSNVKNEARNFALFFNETLM